MVCDFRDMYFATIEILKRPDCPVCQGRAPSSTKGVEGLVWLCGRNTVNINPPQPIHIDLNETYKILKRTFKVLMRSSFVVVLKYPNDVEVSLFNHGRMLIKNVKDEKSALQVYQEIIRSLGLKFLIKTDHI